MSLPPATDLAATPLGLTCWLAQCVAVHVGRNPVEIASDVPLADYGLDSVTALALGAQIEDHLGVALDANALWDHPTIDALAELLRAELTGA